jgi:hypothetical protein
MKHYTYLLTTLIACALSLQSFSQQSAEISLSLKQAQDYALEHNTGMKNAKLDMKLAEECVENIGQ